MSVLCDGVLAMDRFAGGAFDPGLCAFHGGWFRPLLGHVGGFFGRLVCPFVSRYSNMGWYPLNRNFAR